jgi:hypothetical protein
MFKPYFGQGSTLNDLKSPICNLQKQLPKFQMIIKLQEEIHSRQSLYNSFNLILIIYLQQIQLKKIFNQK